MKLSAQNLLQTFEKTLKLSESVFQQVATFLPYRDINSLCRLERVSFRMADKLRKDIYDEKKQINRSENIPAEWDKNLNDFYEYSITMIYSLRRVLSICRDYIAAIGDRPASVHICEMTVICENVQKVVKTSIDALSNHNVTRQEAQTALSESQEIKEFVAYAAGKQRRIALNTDNGSPQAEMEYLDILNAIICFIIAYRHTIRTVTIITNDKR